MHVRHLSLWCERYLALLRQRDQLRQGLGANLRGEVIQLCFQVRNALLDRSSPQVSVVGE